MITGWLMYIFIAICVMGLLLTVLLILMNDKLNNVIRYLHDITNKNVYAEPLTDEEIQRNADYWNNYQNKR